MPSSEKKHPVVCFGEILWDILPNKVTPGGAPMNVAYHLKKLGMEPGLITRVGLDNYGKRLIQLMEKEDISTEFFQMDFELDTGRVTMVPGEGDDVHYDIIKPVAWDNIQWDDQFIPLLLFYFRQPEHAQRSQPQCLVPAAGRCTAQGAGHQPASPALQPAGTGKVNKGRGYFKAESWRAGIADRLVFGLPVGDR